jgi:hypothetical protein
MMKVSFNDIPIGTVYSKGITGMRINLNQAGMIKTGKLQTQGLSTRTRTYFY